MASFLMPMLLNIFLMPFRIVGVLNVLATVAFWKDVRCKSSAKAMAASGATQNPDRTILAFTS
ncbi:hypothetical protein [Candidatus Electronema sp. PJ]|uniref:hypothetical protein n=1 Tax=Candidatus Electronema sp. PJ TaxID=3401572 RepID=UPI003AA9563E